LQEYFYQSLKSVSSSSKVYLTYKYQILEEKITLFYVMYAFN